MRPFIQAFAAAAVLTGAGCSQPYGYGAASYGDIPAYGYGYPGGYSYAGPGYAYAPPPYAYGGIIGVERDDRRRDDWRHHDGENRDRDYQHWHGNQPGSDRGRASQQQFQQQRQAQRLQQQPKQQPELRLDTEKPQVAAAALAVSARSRSRPATQALTFSSRSALPCAIFSLSAGESGRPSRKARAVALGLNG